MLKNIMNKLNEVPVIFIHYPTGSGGWFLSALIHYGFDQSMEFRFDQVGSGHANDHVRYINNFYTDVTLTPEYDKIIKDEGYDEFSYEQRIKFLQDSIIIHRTDITQTLSLHCKNINVFLDAFPNSKCIQINIDDNDLMTCTANFLYKRLLTKTLFDVFCERNGIAIDQIATAYDKFTKIRDSKDNLEYFKWAIPFVLSTAKNVPNDPKFDDRIFEIMFKEYMFDNLDNVLAALLNFAGITYSQPLYDELYGYVLRYRLEQPRFTTE
jgi:hypothetical protein